MAWVVVVRDANKKLQLISEREREREERVVRDVLLARKGQQVQRENSISFLFEYKFKKKKLFEY
jgi:hypothetical protein